SGSADVQSYDANGTAIGPKATMTMGAFFSSVDSGNTVVEGARSVVITNTGSSRINAYARVIDSSTSDTFVVTDPSAIAGSSDAFIAPTISATGSAQTDVYVTNSTGATVNATMNVVVPSTRRRAVRPHTLNAEP